MSNVVLSKSICILRTIVCVRARICARVCVFVCVYVLVCVCAWVRAEYSSAVSQYVALMATTATGMKELLNHRDNWKLYLLTVTM
jgi:hypothetical protein